MPITYRKAGHNDNLATFTVFLKSIVDYSERAGVEGITGGRSPEKMDQLWERRRPLWEHLADTCDQYWVAENGDGEIIGYARSIVRGDHRELTEFFVAPGEQSAGVGKGLIARAFPQDTPHRSIIATTDFRALARYLKAGVYPLVTELFLERVPEPVTFESDLLIEIGNGTDSVLQVTAEIDSVILGHRRDADHFHLMQGRSLYFYKQNGQTIGYGYVSKEYCGPFALLEKAYFPVVLAHAETQAHRLGAESVGFETPAVNTIAIDHLMSRGYRLEGFLTSILSDKPFGKFENYLLTSPPFFL
jgi:GNAT superfamily N-acetyltransferase